MKQLGVLVALLALQTSWWHLGGTDTVVSVEPELRFENTCDSLNYNNLNLKYELVLPLTIEINDIKDLVLTDLVVITDTALASEDAELQVAARLTKPGEAELIFLCDTFRRCQKVEEEAKSNPSGIRQALQFSLAGRAGNSSIKADVIRASNNPRLSCATRRWVLFQRRLNGGISFAQNWDAYEKGFGHPESNYWMGLEKLSAMTITSVNGNAARCEMRIETEDFNGRKFWGEYGRFEVLGPEFRYRLRIGLEVPGSQVTDFGHHNEVQFSTYEKHHYSCSQHSGFGGFWYNDCHRMNPNGAYTTDRTVSDNQIYDTLYIGGKFVPMKSTLMKFRCY